VEGVLNPAAGRTPDGRLFLFPRVVGRGNWSRIGVADVVVSGGVPNGVERRGIALAPDRGWEHGSDHGGVEDPRITWIEPLALHVMTYVAFGPRGPRAALAVSSDLTVWRRLGPMQFAYDDDLGIDLDLFPNKDVVWFPEPIPGPDGEPCLGVLHRPMWEIPDTMGHTLEASVAVRSLSRVTAERRVTNPQAGIGGDHVAQPV
jgi:beta-1,2-mannobiose phosphorylase / 1,2-beta-oligomannan phosphorylase